MGCVQCRYLLRFRFRLSLDKPCPEVGCLEGGWFWGCHTGQWVKTCRFLAEGTLRRWGRVVRGGSLGRGQERCVSLHGSSLLSLFPGCHRMHSCPLLGPVHHALSALEPANCGQKPLKPWAKINLSPFQLHVLSVSHGKMTKTAPHTRALTQFLSFYICLLSYITQSRLIHMGASVRTPLF